MDVGQQTITRDGNGRFVPGCSGNPAGKRPGTRNRATVLAEALRSGEAENIARVVIDKAVSGDVVAARFCLDRLNPRPRGRAIRLELPEDGRAGGDVVAMFNSALRAMAAGEITPDEAVTVARFLEGRIRVLKAWKLERSMTRWDGAPPIPGDDFVAGEEADSDESEASDVRDEPLAANPHPDRPERQSKGPHAGEGGPASAGGEGLPREETPAALAADDPSEIESHAGAGWGHAPPPRMDEAARQIDDAVKMLFDAKGTFRIPPDLTRPKARLLSACISREVTRDLRLPVSAPEVR